MSRTAAGSWRRSTRSLTLAREVHRYRVIEDDTVTSDRPDFEIERTDLRQAPPSAPSRWDTMQDEPTVSLLDAMAAARARDRVAAEYASDFAVTFDTALPALRGALADGLTTDHAIVRVHLELLASLPDTLIARKLGLEAAETVSADAAAALAAGDPGTPAGDLAIAQLDARLRRPDNALNPGTTADLVAGTLFVALLEGVL